MADELPLPAQVTEDVPCRRCGYNLRTLLVDAKCPECGTSVADSLRGNLLRDADPQWLERVGLGIALKLWNIVLGIFGGGAAGFLVSQGFPGALMVLVTLAASVIGFWATYKITTQEPRIALQDDPERLRRALRVCAAVAFLGGLLSHADVGGGAFVFRLIGTILSLAGVFVMWGELCYFRRFADRVPDAKLRKSTTMLMWIAPSTFAVFLIGTVGLALLARTLPKTPIGGVNVAYSTTTAPVPSAAIAVGSCFLLAFGAYLFLWYVRILVKYRKAFREARSSSVAATPTQQL